MTTREIIRSYAAARGLTPNALAGLVASRVSRSQVYDYLNGAHDLTTDKADALLAALSVPMPDPAPDAPAWVVVGPAGHWTGRGFGPPDRAVRFTTWDEAVEAAQEDAGLPAGGPWRVVAV